MKNKPKSYLALDWDDIIKLEKSAIQQLQNNNQSVEAKTILKIIEWMKENNAYEKNYK
jgi:hypothetical protein